MPKAVLFFGVAAALVFAGLVAGIVMMVSPKMETGPRYQFVPVDPNWVDDEIPIGDAGCGN